MGQHGMTFLPAPAYVLARAAWIPTLVIWHADGRFTRLEGDPCEEYAGALAAATFVHLSAFAQGQSRARDRTCACGSLAAGHLRGLRGAHGGAEGQAGVLGEVPGGAEPGEQGAARRRRDQEIRALLEAALRTLGKGAS